MTFLRALRTYWWVLLIVVAAFALIGTLSANAQSLNSDSFYGEAGIDSDYRFRGVSLSGNEPSVNGTLGYDDGFFYAHAQGNSVNLTPFDSTYLELSGAMGVTPNVQVGSTSFGLDFGAEYTTFYGEVPAGTPDLDYYEFYAGANADIYLVSVDAYARYSPDFIFSSGTAWNYEGSASIPVWRPLDFELFGTLGHQSIDDAAGTPFSEWTYYELGGSVNIEGFDVSISYVDTDIDNSLFGVYSDRVDGGAVFRISRSFGN